MKQCYINWKENAKTLKDTHVLVGVSLFFALNVILNLFASIQFTPEIKIGFASIAVAASCYFYGPVPNLLVAPLLDFVNFIVKPSGSYFPIFMISTLATALIFSLVFYHKENITWKHIIIARLAYDFIVSLFLNSLFTSMLWGTPFWVIVVPKFVKNLIGFPFQAIILYLVMKACVQIRPRMTRKY